MSWSEWHRDAASAWGGAEDLWNVLSGGEHRQDQLWPLHHRGDPQQSVSLQLSVQHLCYVPLSLIVLSVSVTCCSRSGAVYRRGEAPDDAMSVWGLWTCVVSTGESVHPHVLPQWWGNLLGLFFLALLKMLCLYSSSCICLCFSSVFSTSALGCWVSC